MLHILLAGRIHDAGLELLKSVKEVTFDYVEEVSTASYVPHLGKADALVIRTQTLGAKEIAAAPRLKIVSRHGVGYDAVDVNALNRRGIALAIVGDVNSRAVAEHTLMLMLAAARRIVAYDAASRNGNWQRRNSFDAVELDGKTLLLYGFGRIGRRVAVLAKAFGMEVLAHDPFVNEAAMREAGVEPAGDIDRALARADFVSIHVPLSPKGAVLGDRELAKLKPSAIVVNAARGGLVDEIALDGALRAGRLAGAALDVLLEEPPKPDHPLLASDRVTISPHNAGLTQECARRMAISSVQNVLDFFAGTLDPKLVVNADQIPRPASA
jgi:D-3-phosphoglycerate dehydrogenase